MMLQHLGVPEAADAVEKAIAAILAQAKVRAQDIRGNQSDCCSGAQYLTPFIETWSRVPIR
jgi:isocitrate/isopropylmalate dehydrogenase